jgi:hypothetical protein
VNIWELKRSITNPNRPTKKLISELQTYIRTQHRLQWRSGKRRNFHESIKSYLKFLELDLVYTPFDSDFLSKPNDCVEVYINKDDSLFYNKSSDVVASCTEVEGKHYADDCFATFVRFNPITLGLDLGKMLKWQVTLAPCGHCGSLVEESELVHNDSTGKLVDKHCDHKLRNWVNKRPDPMEPICSYHSHKNSWMFLVQQVGSEKSIPMGCEIELHSVYGNDKSCAIDSARNILVKQEDSNFYFEWDGSLTEGGFEVITNPMTLEYHHKYWEGMLTTLRKSCVGYNVEKQYYKNRNQVVSESDLSAIAFDYGIHVTVHRKNIPDSVITKIVKFFDSDRNKDFLWAIAQRSSMYGGYTLGSKPKPQAKTTVKFRDKKIVGGVDRRQPVNIKGKDFIEFRMFRSTLNQVSFLKNLEFIDALITYLKELPGVKIDHRTFILWLQKNSARYPNLLTYLQHPLFFVKGAGKVKNTWSDLFTNYKLVIKDPLKEYGPKPLYIDQLDQEEGSMV